jgi:hypothetical protein
MYLLTTLQCLQVNRLALVATDASNVRAHQRSTAMLCGKDANSVKFIICEARAVSGGIRWRTDLMASLCEALVHHAASPPTMHLK